MKASPASKSPSVAWKPRQGRPPLRPARARVASSADPLSLVVEGSMNQHTPLQSVPFIDIGAQRRRLGKSIDEAVARVLAHCQFINGPEVAELEKRLAVFSGARHVVSSPSGTE